MDFRNYYRVLGVARTATDDEIRLAFRRAARRLHPDVCQDPDASVRMAEVNEAYEVLSDKDRRRVFDRFGARHGVMADGPWAEHVAQPAQPPTQTAAQPFARPPMPTPAPEPRGQRHGEHGASASGQPPIAGKPAAGSTSSTDHPTGLADRVASLFGRHPSGADNPVSGSEPLARVDITVTEAYRGACKTLDIGAEHRVTIRLPKGVRHRQRVRVHGKGPVRAPGGQPQDLLVEVRLIDAPDLRAEGRDVYQKLPVTPWEAALGGTVSFTSVAGPVVVSIAPDTPNGQRICVPGMGLPASRPGDLYLELDVVLPSADSEAARRLYAMMARELAFDPRAGGAVPAAASTGPAAAARTSDRMPHGVASASGISAAPSAPAKETTTA